MIQKFCKLTRLVLENSMSQLVPFENDWKSLQLYIELEQMRYTDKFMVSYNVQPKIKDQGHMIPPMIIQPFVENGIIHGLRNKDEENGILDLSASLENGYIVVQVISKISLKEPGSLLHCLQKTEFNCPGTVYYRFLKVLSNLIASIKSFFIGFSSISSGAW